MSILDIEAIRELLPHRYPFLLVDRILEVEPGKFAVGVKNVTANEEFFQGHFPGYSVMPGVLIIEAMAQVGGVMMNTMEEHKGKVALLATIDKAKFRKPVVPGDTLTTTVQVIRARGNTWRVGSVAKVGGQVVAEAEIMFALVHRSTKPLGPR